MTEIIDIETTPLVVVDISEVTKPIVIEEAVPVGPPGPTGPQGPPGATSPPSGAAGGDLGGTYPNPTVVKASGAFNVVGGLTGTTGTFTGNIITNGGYVMVDRTGDATSGVVYVRADPGFVSALFFQGAGNLQRWQFYKNGTAESGSNAGSDLTLNHYADDGTTALGVALFANRATGHVSLGTSATTASRLYLRGTGQTTASFDPAGAQGSGVYLQDTGAGVGNGGSVMFGCNFGPHHAIKASAVSGVGPVGDLVISGRRLGADTTFTEQVRFRYDGSTIFSGAVTAATFSGAVNTSGAITQGHSTLVPITGYGVSINPALQITQTAGGVDPTISLQRYSASANGPVVNLSLSHGATLGTQTIVANNEILGMVNFNGSDGTKFVEGAQIRGTVDGTPGVNDMPTRLGFFTSADGVAAPTEAMRIASDKTVTMYGPLTTNSTTAIGAGSNTQAFLKASSTANLGIYYGTGAPAFTAAKGSLYSNTTATTTTTRLYVNTDGASSWATLTTSI